MPQTQKIPQKKLTLGK